MTIITFIRNKAFAQNKILLANILFLVITSIPGIDLNHISSWSQLRRFEGLILKTPINELKATQPENSILRELNSLLNVINKVHSADYIKSKLKKVLPSLSQNESDKIYENILTAQSEQYKSENCSVIAAAQVKNKNSQLTSFVSFSTRVSNTYLNEGAGIFVINKDNTNISVGTKKNGMRDFNLKELINFTADSLVPLRLSGNSGNFRYEILIDDARICPISGSYFSGILFFDYH